MPYTQGQEAKEVTSKGAGIWISLFVEYFRKQVSTVSFLVLGNQVFKIQTRHKEATYKVASYKIVHKEAAYEVV